MGVGMVIVADAHKDETTRTRRTLDRSDTLPALENSYSRPFLAVTTDALTIDEHGAQGDALHGRFVTARKPEGG